MHYTSVVLDKQLRSVYAALNIDGMVMDACQVSRAHAVLLQQGSIIMAPAGVTV